MPFVLKSKENATTRTLLRVEAARDSQAFRPRPQTIRRGAEAAANSTHKRPLCGHCAPALRGFPANRAAPAACVLGDLHSNEE